MIRRLTSRIGRFHQIAVLSEIAIILLTVTVVGLVDLTGFSTACVGGWGARALFYVLSAIEAVAIVQVIRFRARQADVNAFRAEAASLADWSQRQACRAHVTVAVVLFAIIVLFGSFMLGYGGHALCGEWPARRIISDYWYLLAVNFGRTLCLIIAPLLVLLPWRGARWRGHN